jgi:hypothetical protein
MRGGGRFGSDRRQRSAEPHGVSSLAAQSSRKNWEGWDTRDTIVSEKDRTTRLVVTGFRRPYNL